MFLENNSSDIPHEIRQGNGIGSLSRGAPARKGTGLWGRSKDGKMAHTRLYELKCEDAREAMFSYCDPEAEQVLTGHNHCNTFMCNCIILDKSPKQTKKTYMKPAEI